MMETKNDNNSFILHGSAVYSKGPSELAYHDNAYIVCVNGISEGIHAAVPAAYKQLPIIETDGKLIMPGLVDLHTHASQYQFRGNGMDAELLSWLEAYTFPEEARYSDLSYADKAYRLFADEMKRGGTTRAAIFATADRRATFRLMEIMEDTGLISYVGKVNMDRNVPDYYVEDTAASLRETEKWLDQAFSSGLRYTRPIITPRFTPSCTRKLMEGLSRLAKEYKIPVQSHLCAVPSVIMFHPLQAVLSLSVREPRGHADCRGRRFPNPRRSSICAWVLSRPLLSRNKAPGFPA